LRPVFGLRLPAHNVVATTTHRHMFADGLASPPLQDTAVRQDLLNRVNLALRIAKRTAQFLGTDGFTSAEVPEANFAAEKPLAETSILLYVASRERSDPAIRDRFDELVLELIPFARSERMAWDILLHPSVCLELATPHILLGVLGCPDSKFDDLLARTVGACSSRGHEVTPYREMERLWLRSLWRDESPDHEFEEAGRKTALVNPIDLLNGTRDDAYAHTHAVMYYTGFGNWEQRLPRSLEEFLGESAAVLARALITEDYDLAAEALLAWPLTSSDWSPAAAFGFRVLASLEDKIGFLPAGPLVSKRMLELHGEEKTKYALASSYHTAFVMGMLCAASLETGMVSPFEIVGPQFPMTLIEDLRASIPQGGAHWEQVFQCLSQDEQAALAPFLLDVAIIQISRKGDFARMPSLLGIAIQHGLAGTTLCAQTAELLSRMAFLL
jgi:hypothetical protein